MKVIGTGSVLANLTSWQKIKFRAGIKNAINETRLKVEDDARRMAPKDTGLLKSTIDSEMIDDFSAQIFDGVHYGIYVEKGTVKMAPQPFLIPALEANAKVLERELKKIIT